MQSLHIFAPSGSCGASDRTPRADEDRSALSEIAFAACGLSRDYTYFARGFRQRFGITPGAVGAGATGNGTQTAIGSKRRATSCNTATSLLIFASGVSKAQRVEIVHQTPASVFCYWPGIDSGTCGVPARDPHERTRPIIIEWSPATTF